MRNLLVIVLLLLFFSASAQESCPKASEWYKNYERFMPMEPRSIMTVRVNMVIPQRSDGTGNFQEGDEELEFLMKKIFEQVNTLWSDMKDPRDAACYDGDLFIPDTYVRFVHNATIHYQDDRFWNAENGSGCPRETNWWLNEIDSEIRKDDRYARAINVYLPVSESAYEALMMNISDSEPKATPPCSEMPTYRDLNRSSRINLAGTYNKYYWMKNVVTQSKTHNQNGYEWDPTIRQWFYSTMGHTLAHEVGHSLGLGHGNQHHKRNKCETSLMHQGHNKPHNYLPPTEIGKIHRALRMTNVRHFLEEEVYSAVPLVIDADAVIDISHKSYEDIIVKSGQTLTVTCELIMPKEGRIVIEKGATLIIDGGRVTGPNGTGQWAGLDIQKGKKCFLRKKTKQEGGVFEVKNGGTLTGCSHP